MLAALIRKSAVILLVYQVFAEGKDLLQLYKPKPDLPTELNDFLTNVQQHKHDFAIIRNYAKKQKKMEKDLIENHRLFLENMDYEDYPTAINYNQKRSYRPSDMVPANDIYPYMYQNKLPYSKYPSERYSKYIHSPIRLRRGLDSNYLEYPLEVNSMGRSGEMKRAGMKYPEKISYDNPKNDKREVEISIKTDGKLVKRIEENDNAAKSIVLNIQPTEEKKTEVHNVKDVNTVPALNNAEADGTTLKLANVPANSISQDSKMREPNRNFGIPMYSELQNNNKDVKVNNKPSSVVKQGNKMPMDSFNMQKSNLQSDFFKPFPPVHEYSDKRWSNTIGGSQMEKGIDIAQNNVINDDPLSKKDNFFSSGDTKKDSDFEKVKGVVIDTKEDPNSETGNQFKRQLDFNSHSQSDDLPSFNFQPLAVDFGTTPFDYLAPLDYDSGFGPCNTGGGNNNLKYKVVEHTTKDVLITPLEMTTPEEPLNIGGETLEQQEEEQKHEPSEEHKNEVDEVVEVIKNHHHEPNTEGEETEKEPEVEEDVEIIKTDEENAEKELEKVEHEIEHEKEEEQTEHVCPGKHKHIRVDRDHKKHKHKKRKHKKKKKKVMIVSPKIHESGVNSHNSYDSYRDRKHLPALPKYKKRKFHHHYKKRVFRDQGLREYDPEREAFDLIPAYRGRQLKAVESMYDAYLGDFGDDESIKGSDMKRSRKKMKSEGDYADEEDSVTMQPVKKKLIQLKKIENEFGYPPKIESQSEDEDYSYSEINNNNSDKKESLEESATFKQPVTRIELTERNTKKVQNNQPSLLQDAISDIKHQDLVNIARGHGRSKGKKSINPDKNTKKPLAQKSALSDQEKEDLFLRFNPEFQRWPRFVIDNNRYAELMKKRSVENGRRRYFVVPRDGYFVRPSIDRLNRNAQLAKREDATTAAAAKETSAAAPAGGGETPAAASTTAPAGDAETPPKSAAPGAEDKNTPAGGETQGASEKANTTPAEAGASKNMDTDATMNPNIAAEATLPDSVQQMMKTVSGDIFENTTVPGAPANNQPSGTEPKTTYHLPADYQSGEPECSTHAVKVTICEEENAKHSPVVMTTMLTLVNDSSSLYKMNQSAAEYLDLTDVLAGNLPRQVVTGAWSEAKGSVKNGLKGKQLNINTHLMFLNNSAETRTVLNEMTKLMIQLQHSTSCQQLPPIMRLYLKQISKIPTDDVLAKLREMQDVDFDEHQGSYVFHTAQNDNLQNKVDVMKELLNKYNNLPPDCKDRAEPVKEYIENHLAMLNNMMAGTKTGHASANKPKQRKTSMEQQEADYKYSEGTGTSDSEEEKLQKEKLIQQQLDQIGLGDKQGFSPKFDLDKLMKGNKKRPEDHAEKGTTPKIGKREINTSTSPQYGKLVEAIRKLRHRRESEKRIGEIYGKSQMHSQEMGEFGDGYMKKKEDKVEFEAPLVLNF